MNVDCRGLTCPQPVLETKKALEKSGDGHVWVLLDNKASQENVRRFAQSRGHQVQVTEEAGIFTLKIEKGKGSTERQEAGDSETCVAAGVVVFLDSDSLGRGSEELGKKLMRSFLQVLEQSDVRPEKVLLINGGVKLACEGSEVLEDLWELSNKGAEILACGTCLDYFGLKKKLLAGKVSDMYQILTSLAQAGKVIKM
jgi:selenium metabolism protein YedF